MVVFYFKPLTSGGIAPTSDPTSACSGISTSTPSGSSTQPMSYALHSMPKLCATQLSLLDENATAGSGAANALHTRSTLTSNAVLHAPR